MASKKVRREMSHYNQSLTYTKVIEKPRGFLTLKTSGQNTKKAQEHQHTLHIH